MCVLPCNNTLQWSAGRDVFVSLSLRRLGLLLETVPVGGVFLRQGRGHGDELAERQQRERGRRRARRSMTLMGGAEEEKDLNLCFESCRTLIVCSTVLTGDAGPGPGPSATATWWSASNKLSCMKTQEQTSQLKVEFSFLVNFAGADSRHHMTKCTRQS